MDRAVVQLSLTAVMMLLVWGMVAVFGAVPSAGATAVGLKWLVTGDNSGVPYLPMFVATFCTAAGAERILSTLSGRPYAPWDAIANSRVTRRRQHGPRT